MGYELVVLIIVVGMIVILLRSIPGRWSSGDDSDTDLSDSDHDSSSDGDSGGDGGGD